MKDLGLYFISEILLHFPSNSLSLCFTKATKNLSFLTQKLRSIGKRLLLFFEILLKASKFLVTKQPHH